MRLKFLHIKSHIIHICLLTEFEIFFYIYYVMPYEKTIFNNLFEIKGYNLPNVNNSYFDNENNKCSSYQKQLDDDNSKLYDYCYTYIVIINVILFVFFLYDFFKTYCIFNLPKSPKYNSKSSLVSFNSFTIDYKKNDDTEDSLELVDIEKIDSDFTKIDKIDKIDKQIKPSYFIIYYWNNSGFLYELIKTIEFIILIGIFEYCFFKFIVNEFKIANNKTILCNIIKKLHN